MVADERVYFTSSADRCLRREFRERDAVLDDVIEVDSVNSGDPARLESIVSASHVLNAVDSSQDSELVTTM